MSPLSDPPPPFLFPPRLVDLRPGAAAPTFVDVAIIRGFPPARLGDVERTWGPARDALASAAGTAGLSLESAHWNWRNIVRPYPPGWHCVVGIEFEGDIQGLMAVQTRLRRSLLAPDHWVVYVDYLEVAPWNYGLSAVQKTRFGGVGMLLLGEAVRMSIGPSANGRVGLHSLPSTEHFFGNRCRMVRVGPDPDYFNLVYFEYPGGVAAEWLTDEGLTV